MFKLYTGMREIRIVMQQLAGIFMKQLAENAGPF